MAISPATDRRPERRPLTVTCGVRPRRPQVRPLGQAQRGGAGLRVVAAGDHVVGGGEEVFTAAQPAGGGGAAFLVVRVADEGEFWSRRAGFLGAVAAGGVVGHDENARFPSREC
ncbi:hypothetical protein AB0O20_37050 [Streptomyces kronopolitis]|uniref:hypothetical protein n=1 Tax=Streptomyces kronopolitis TaxID=1612435 RepID=UPI00341C29E7